MHLDVFENAEAFNAEFSIMLPENESRSDVVGQPDPW